jgi:hypothetical protein
VNKQQPAVVPAALTNYAAVIVRCCSTPAALVSPPNPMLVSVVEALFKFPPLFEQATKKVS